MNNEMGKFTFNLVHETRLAYLVSIDCKSIWFKKNQVQEVRRDMISRVIDLEIPNDILREKELL